MIDIARRSRVVDNGEFTRGSFWRRLSQRDSNRHKCYSGLDGASYVNPHSQVTPSNLTLPERALPGLAQAEQAKQPLVQNETMHERKEVKVLESAPPSGASSPNSKRIICFGQGDPANPFNWSTVCKADVCFNQPRLTLLCSARSPLSFL